MRTCSTYNLCWDNPLAGLWSFYRHNWWNTCNSICWSMSSCLLSTVTIVLDTVRGDLVYTVPILTPTTREHTLCYEIYRQPNQFFNLVSDVCVNVNAHYVTKPWQVRDLHIIDEVTVRATDTTWSWCRNIATELVGNKYRVSVDGHDQMLNNTGTRYTQHGITIHSFPRRARITVPNCDNICLVMWVIFETK